MPDKIRHHALDLTILEWFEVLGSILIAACLLAFSLWLIFFW